jgi:hypothetical protein
MFDGSHSPVEVDATVPLQVPLPDGATAPLIGQLDPDDPRSVNFQISRMQTLLTVVLPPAVADTARQAVLLRNADWCCRAAAEPVGTRVALDVAHTRVAVLAARSDFERSRTNRRFQGPPKQPNGKQKNGKGVKRAPLAVCLGIH